MVAGLINYRGEHLTVKQLASKHNLCIESIYQCIGAKFKGHEISWVIPKKKKESDPILQKKRLISYLKELDAQYQECIDASKIIIKSLEDDIWRYEQMK